KWADKNSSLEKICRENWPGALTLIIKTMNNGKIGLRMPDCAPLLHLMEITGPLCATSANISGEPAPVRTCDVPGEIRRECDVIESFGVRPHGRPSKVVDISSEKEFTLRE
ncbi:MAG: L-threonylcarbamoyladenylate synthase, partial [Elusimicrobiota bacterium]